LIKYRYIHNVSSIGGQLSSFYLNIFFQMEQIQKYEICVLSLDFDLSFIVIS